MHHTLRTVILQQIELSNDQPNPVQLRLFKLAVHVVEYKDRIKLQRPSQWPVKSWPYRVTEILSQVPPPPWWKTAGSFSVPNRFELFPKGKWIAVSCKDKNDTSGGNRYVFLSTEVFNISQWLSLTMNTLSDGVLTPRPTTL